MKLKRKNIITFFVLLLLASFSISFTHTFLEQTGSTCINHEDHDFSKVIVNVLLKDNSDNNNTTLTLTDIPCIIDSPSYLPAVPTIECSGYFHHPPLIYSDQIYITKSKSLLI